MKPEELRIGNWITYKSTKVKWSLEDYAEWGHNIELTIQPILLTEEWLERAGFEEVNHNWIINYHNTHQGEMKIFLYRNKGIWQFSLGGGFTMCSLDYVHQLQNLYFALTGEELTIKETVA